MNMVYMVDLIGRGVITYDDLSDFSEDLKQAVQMLLDRNRR